MTVMEGVIFTRNGGGASNGEVGFVMGGRVSLHSYERGAKPTIS